MWLLSHRRTKWHVFGLPNMGWGESQTRAPNRDNVEFFHIVKGNPTSIGV